MFIERYSIMKCKRRRFVVENYNERTKNHFNENAESYDESFDGRFVKPMYQGLVDELDNLQEGYLVKPLRALMNFAFKFSNSGDYHIYGRNEMKKIMKKNGFRLESVKRTSKHTVLYIARAFV